MFNKLSTPRHKVIFLLKSIITVPVKCALASRDIGVVANKCHRHRLCVLPSRDGAVVRRIASGCGVISSEAIMINDKTVMIVMPAYRAGKTLRSTWEAIPHDVVDEVLLVDDASDDETVAIARELGLRVKCHSRNIGYGGNQKTCYADALEQGADIIVMLHPDYQYEPRLVTAMAAMVSSGVYDVVIGSRILGGGALKGGMPWWKYAANRLLTAFQNFMLGAKLSEYHTGYRAFSRDVLKSIPWQSNSNDFQFDNELLAQVILSGLTLGEISVPTKYFAEASSINFSRSVRYGLGVLWISILGFLFRASIYRHRLFANVS